MEQRDINAKERDRRYNTGDFNRNSTGDTNEVTAETSATEETVVEVETETDPAKADAGLKSKLLASTDRMGMTSSGSLTKSFFWGMGVGLVGVFLFNWAKEKGYINMK